MTCLPFDLIIKELWWWLVSKTFYSKELIALQWSNKGSTSSKWPQTDQPHIWILCKAALKQSNTRVYAWLLLFTSCGRFFIGSNHVVAVITCKYNSVTWQFSNFVSWWGPTQTEAVKEIEKGGKRRNREAARE